MKKANQRHERIRDIQDKGTPQDKGTTKRITPLLCRSKNVPLSILLLFLITTILIVFTLSNIFMMSHTQTNYMGDGDGYHGKLLDVEEYTVVQGIFKQSDPSSSPSGRMDSFGLIDKSQDRWMKFEQHIKRLNQEADKYTTYKVLYIARHGQGVHNLAEEKYGTPAWNAKWSLLYTDGELIWGPDPLLTEKGRQQIRKTAQHWGKEINAGIPLPGVLYSSPLRRAIDTVEITWNGVLPITTDRMVKENLREMIGLHTCDKRSTRSLLEKEYPNYHFDTSFTEEDELWTPDHQETDRQITKRARSFLDSLFAEDKRTFISITGHGGIIGGLMRSLGHVRIGLETGGMIPMVIKATSRKKGIVREHPSDQSNILPQDTTNNVDVSSTSEAQSAGTIRAEAELKIQSP